ncbi:MAG: carboxypeptidase regulatory-like domain-containing protein [Polyangiaceae bacterium]|nr:carboxypeptidase regulatory-like domain-containing protein [Polyangiaceae bacterium]
MMHSKVTAALVGGGLIGLVAGFGSPACSSAGGGTAGGGGFGATSGGDSSLGGTGNAAASGGNEGGIIIDVNVEATPPCKGLQCDIPSCSGGGTTTISGTVYAPNGTLPLYNAIVYIPLFRDEPLDPITLGASCDKCNASIKNTVRTTLSDHEGKFTLENVPAGANIPLVVQIGKWRRMVTLPSVDPCTSNALSDPAYTRLPKNQSEGDMPQMAMVTGGCDPLPCLFRKIGIDDPEFSNPNGAGRMHIFRGRGGADVQGGGAPNAWQGLWDSLGNLMKYDITLLSCECDEYNGDKSAAQKGFMRDYLNLGGRVFATHFHYTWFKNGPTEFQALADWQSPSTSNPYTIETGFPKGMAFMQWLQFVSTSVTTDQINLTEIRHDVATVNPGAQRWIYKPAAGSIKESVKYFTFNTPIGAEPESQCGRGVFSDIHVSSGSASTVPTSCNSNPLTDQEKALVFLFFDLSSCIQPDDEKPVPPPVPAPAP